MERLGSPSRAQRLAFDRPVFAPPLRAETAELVARNPDVIVTTGAPTLAAAHKATSTIPIVFVLVWLREIVTGKPKDPTRTPTPPHMCRAGVTSLIVGAEIPDL
jgi:hypothetical protein